MDLLTSTALATPKARAILAALPPGSPPPLVVQLHSQDKEPTGESFVAVYCSDKEAARFDQTIDGTRWECPNDMDFAYACILDRPGLIPFLEAEGYVAADTSWYFPY